MTIQNSIVANNLASSSPELSLNVQSPLAVEFSLIGNNYGTQLTPAPVGSPDEDGNLIGTSTQPIDPRIEPLADNGGPTLTHAIRPNSPVVDAGSTLEADQRGISRPIDLGSLPNSAEGNGADMGALELQFLDGAYLPNTIVVPFEVTSQLNLSAATFIYESSETQTVTLSVDSGTLGQPGDGTDVGVMVELVTPQVIEISGPTLGLNRYFDNPSNLTYTPPLGAAGNNASSISVSVFDGNTSIASGTIDIDISEPSRFVVTTASDTVDPLDQLTSLREAIMLANQTEGVDSITFEEDLAGQTIALNLGSLQIHDGLVIDASGLTEQITVDARQQSRAIEVDSLSGADINFDLSLTGFRVSGGSTEMENGGGILFASEGTLSLDQMTISGNSTGLNGGGVWASSATVVITGSEISDNISRVGGGGIWASRTNLTIHESTVSGNESGEEGGGIWFQSSQVLIEQTQITDNASRYPGTSLILTDGGGVHSRSSTVSIQDSSISSNDASYGGGINSSFSSLTIAQSTLNGNTARRIGGGIRSSGISSSTVDVIDTSITANTAYRSGGGISVSDGSLTLAYSTLADNNAKFGSGGGIATSRFTTVTGSTVSGNTAARGGGVFTSADTAIESTTFTRNLAGNGLGGGIYLSSLDFEPTLTLTNSIVAANLADGSVDIHQEFGTTLVPEFSLIGDNSGTTLLPAPVGEPDSLGNLVGTPGNPIQPLLAPLNDTGGFAPTHAPLLGSPVLDMGSSTMTRDQRGVARTVDLDSAPNSISGNTADIGAVELQALAANYLPEDITAIPEVTNALDFSEVLITSEAVDALTVAIVASLGSFEPPQDGAAFEVVATQDSPQSISLMGDAIDINRYLDAIRLSFAPPAGTVGDNQGTFDVFISDGMTTFSIGSINIDIRELQTLIVNASHDVVDPFDGERSLREALDAANRLPGSDTVTFSAGLSGQTISLVHGQLVITDSVMVSALTLAENITIDALEQSRVFKIGVEGTVEDLDVTLSGLSITNGLTAANGGGIQFNNPGSLKLERTTVSESWADERGGGIWTSSADISLHDSTIRGNYRGGITSDDGSINLTSSQVIGTEGAFVGGVSSWTGRVTVSHSQIIRNSAEGVETISGAINITHSQISENEGTGIFTTFGFVDVSDSTVSDNHDGGIFTPNSPIRIKNSTVSGNHTEFYGGGIRTRGLLRVMNSTITNNSAAYGGGISIRTSGTTSSPQHLIIQNSIVARNSAEVAPDLLTDSEFDISTGVSNSLIGSNTGTTLTWAPVGVLDARGNLIGSPSSSINPLLGPLTNNGGPTLTHSLLFGSPALNAGDPLAEQNGVPPTDQRGAGFDRIVGGRIDMGAFEAQIAPIDGDFDNDGDYDCQDIDALTSIIVMGGSDLSFDMDGNGVLNGSDLPIWLALAGANNLSSGRPFLAGDANLDGVVDVSDFNRWNENKFTAVTGWCSGDFNADGVVDVSDFNIWNENKFSSSDMAGSRTIPQHLSEPRYHYSPADDQPTRKSISMIDLIFREWNDQR